LILGAGAGAAADGDSPRNWQTPLSLKLKAIGRCYEQQALLRKSKVEAVKQVSG